MSSNPFRSFPAFAYWFSPFRQGALTGGVLLWSLLALPLGAQTATEEPRITDFRLTLEDRQALASFRLTGAVDERFLERVESGLPTAFVYRFELIKIRRGWFDKTVDSTTLQVVTMYDAIERQYLVNFKLAGKLIRSETVHEVEELKTIMTRFEEQPVFTLETLPADWRLRIRVRGELGAKTIFSLIPARITTPWVESPRFRATEANP